MAVADDPIVGELLDGVLGEVVVPRHAIVVEEFIFGQNFLVTALPHFTLDRYTALLRQVEVHDMNDLETLVLNHMQRIGWIKWLSDDEFRFLRPFHRVFSKCIELTQASQTPPTGETASASGEDLLNRQS